jgi:hypothetical protein
MLLSRTYFKYPEAHLRDAMFSQLDAASTPYHFCLILVVAAHTLRI